MLININPCYDISKRADCPDRKEGYAATCEKWRKHRETKEKEYHQRVIKGDGKPRNTSKKNGKNKRK